MRTVPSHYIRLIVQRLSGSGHAVEPILRELSLFPDVIRESRSMVPVEQFVALVRRAWQLMDDEYWGLTEQRCKPGHFALMVRYVHQFDTLSPLLTELCRFYNTTREDVHLSIESSDDQCYLFLDLERPDLDSDHYLCEFMMTSFHRFLCWITGRQIQLRCVRFTYSEPAHAVIYDDLFPCKREFDQNRCCLGFSNEYLSLPLVRGWSEVRKFLQEAPAELMFMPGNDDRFTTRVKAILLEQFHRGERFSDLNSAASELCVSPQTLRRKLQSEDSSYQKVKDLIRRDVAIYKLTREKLPVAEVGQLVGFIEAASFTRAFKQWTGLSPAEYRNTHIAPL
jgi:AraC-like DNA-binding protein